MKKVCDDFGGLEWFFDNGAYYKRKQDGTIHAYLKPEFIPNPDELWKAKCAQAGVKEGTKDAYVNGRVITLKPTNAVYALWQYEQGRNA